MFSDPAIGRAARLEPVMRQGRLDGVKLYRIVPGSPPARLGLRNGDEVRAVDGRRLRDLAIERDVPRLRAAERVELSVVRAGRPVRLVIEILPARSSR